jgi:glutaredoxin-like YruB-family protein
MTYPPITIYSTPTCGYCKMAKEYLASKSVPFVDVDVAADRAKQEEMIAKSGQFGVPVIDVGGKIIVGFDKRKLDEYAGITS